MDTADETPGGSRPGLPRVAWIYLAGVYAAGLVVALAGLPVTVTRADLHVLVVLSALAAVAQLFVVITPRNQSYHLTPGIVIAAAILLPPPLVVVVVVVQHVPEWIKERYPWFIQVFNIANYAIGGVCAALVFDLVNGLPADRVGGVDGRYFLAGLLASLLFVVVTHFLLALALLTARGHDFRESELFTFHSLSMDTVLAVLGVVVAALWEQNALLIALALAPLVLLHRTLLLPKLEAEARQDPKTGLYNARFFSVALGEAVERSNRAGEPVSLLLADLDLLREINNSYGHLAGDAVLAGVAAVFRDSIRPSDIAARFGGEEFCVLLPDTDPATAREIAERIRGAVEESRIEVDTATEPISVTISVGVASATEEGATARDLLHLADVAVYRAKAEGRNRIAVAGDAAGSASPYTVAPSPAPAYEPVASAAVAEAQVRPDAVTAPVPLPNVVIAEPASNGASSPPPAPNHFALRPSVRGLALGVGTAGLLAGTVVSLADSTIDAVALALLVGLVAVGQALAVEVLDHESISVSAVGCLAGAALIGPTAALPLAAAVCVVEWVAHRPPSHKLAFNCGALTLSSLAAAGIFALFPSERWIFVAGGSVAGSAYYAVNVGLLATVISLETRERWLAVMRERFAWLYLYYVVYGVVGAMVAVGYDVAGALGVVLFALPLVLVRKAQLDYIAHTEASVRQLRNAAATIERQNESLVEANALLRQRATESMESLAAAVDARDAYTAGHSRRVQTISVAIAHHLGLDEREVSAISYAALFHDVGKLAVPDAILLKQTGLEEHEWELVKQHPVEGARIIGHLGFLVDATPAIEHHHERYDGSGYPDGMVGEEIPLGARVVHVADAFDSMISSRHYSDAVSVLSALDELRSGAGTQFCPTCIAAFEHALDAGELESVLEFGAAA
jgi:diguanylate cyclase (GGDEF)-like protein